MFASKAQQKSLARLKNRADFLKIQSKGQKWVSHGLILQLMPNELGQKRVGFTVSKKVSNSAVKRNRIKRRLRAVAADILPLHAKDGVDYILVGRPLTATRPYEALQNDLKWCLEKTGFTK
ncbi:MAG: ribonuclease P protein component [Alphaproteobacteria bacterium]|nr:ribonuclease P protein component [Alphaproteobacteria bacterium]